MPAATPVQSKILHESPATKVVAVRPVVMVRLLEPPKTTLDQFGAFTTTRSEALTPLSVPRLSLVKSWKRVVPLRAREPAPPTVRASAEPLEDVGMPASRVPLMVMLLPEAAMMEPVPPRVPAAATVTAPEPVAAPVELVASSVPSETSVPPV